jgi:hypothetical protein
MLISLWLLGCGEPPPSASEMLAGVDALSARLHLGNVTEDEFQEALGPWQPMLLKTWQEPDLEAASLSLFRLRASLVERYGEGQSYCSDDRDVLWDSCGAGYLCATFAMLGELRCIWSTQVKR